MLLIRNLLNYDPYEHYLTEHQLCEESGLTVADLAQLADAHLLLPDTKAGKYRPKLIGWGRKLAYLIQDGWDVSEIKAWAMGRWASKDPRKWPPDRR